MDFQELLNVGNKKYSNHCYYEALEYYLKALNYAETHLDLSSQNNIREKIALSYYCKSNFIESIRHFDILQQVVFGEQLINVITLKSIALHRLGNFKEALENLKFLNQFSCNLANRKKFMTQGVIYLRMAQFLDSQTINQAMESFKAALNYSDDNSVTHKLLRNIGITYNFTGDYLKSLQYYEKALQIPISEYSISHTYHEMANSYAHLNNFTKAKSLLEFSHKVATEMNDDYGLGYTLKNLGEVHFLEGDIELGEELLNQAVDLFLPSQSYPEISSCFKLLHKQFETVHPGKAQVYSREHQRYKSKLAI